MSYDPSPSIAAGKTLTQLGDRDREDADVEDIAARALAGLGSVKLTTEQKEAKKQAEAKLKERYNLDLNRDHRTFVEGGDLAELVSRLKQSAGDDMYARALLREAWMKGFRHGFNRGRLLTDL